MSIGTDYLLKRAQAKDAETQTESETTVEISRGSREGRERRREDKTGGGEQNSAIRGNGTVGGAIAGTRSRN